MTDAAPQISEASADQLRAAAPDRSTWLKANAGSGKTRVLTDRVARLLLDEVPPERILCLTYTKAAAMEMQNRLFRRLGEWAMRDDADLRAALTEVGVDPARLTSTVMARARTLFARAIEAPGGLKIQTIHSFCSSVLRRFPLEAGISPGFTEIDDRSQSRLIADLLDELADSPEGQAAIDAVSPFLNDEQGIIALARQVAGRAEDLAAPMDWPAICAWVGIAPDLTEAAILATALDGSERDLAAALCPHLDLTNSRQKRPREILEAMPWGAMTLTDLALLEQACLSGASARAPFVARPIGNDAMRAAAGPDVIAAYTALSERVEAASLLRRGLITARKVAALHAFAAAFLPAYGAAKQARGWLDFDDLITRMRRLLSTPGVAQWVLFRLDGGIDHILVDEAQDTSPAQWEIVRGLAEEFAAGEGARAGVERSIFVVGDTKQSIYSFQGADPAGFDRMAAFFDEKLRGIGQSLQQAQLKWSFRSSPVILDLVDRIFGGEHTAGVERPTDHKAFFGAKPGRVDLWPVVPKSAAADPPPWDEPIALIGEEHHTAILARLLADRVADMLAEGVEIEVDKGERRPIAPGDILILVQRRSELFRKIIGALKRKGLPVAGVDRAELRAPIAVKDLIALMKFLATPEDDLSLAALLKSPICGWDETALYDLAEARRSYLWRALQDRRADWPETVAMLEDLRDQAEYLRPYDLLERALVRHDARRNLMARLGPEAEDAIDAMLAQALAFETVEVPSLVGFVSWLEADTVTVKRDLGEAEGLIRVMTVHGAKGLEAPVVILPDCAMPGGAGRGAGLVQPEDGPLVWPPSANDTIAPVHAAVAEASAKRREERDRLLYVALTRAESWLIVAAAGDVGKRVEGSWYNTVRDAMEAAPSTPLTLPEMAEAGLRLQHGDMPVRGPAAPEAPPPTDEVLPDWATTPARRSPRDARLRSPSDLGGAKVILDDAMPATPATDVARPTDDPDARRRGRAVHLLLEHLPRLPPPAWRSAAPGLLAMEDADVTEAEIADILAEAQSVLTHPDLAPLFAGGQAAEVTLTAPSAVLNAPLKGIIDRLLVTPKAVTAIDFKTNSVVPGTPQEVPEGLLRQMGAYADMLTQIYPDRRVETAILWTRTAQLMPLPHDLVIAALARAADA